MTQVIPDAFWQAVEEFNRGQFYECHDTLEALWMEANEPPQSFYQGILQIAVACYHLGNKNWRGAVVLLGEGIQRLRRYPPVYFELEVDRLVDQSADLLEKLQQAGPERVAEFSRLVSDRSDPTLATESAAATTPAASELALGSLPTLVKACVGVSPPHPHHP